ncbi:hypothetical protein EBS02_09655, partial [bacterium]|nr:hypothetical protein [bacterium]
VIMKDGRICYQERSGWIEITQAVLEYNNQYHALEGSLAVTTGAVLSLEEKFQGGTGTNLTPIPFLTQENRLFLKHYVCLAAETLSIKNYARFDLFYHQKRQEIIVIEVNTLPALTPSTVLYHQALADHTPHEPRSLLELLITRGLRDQKERFKELLAKVVTY